MFIKACTTVLYPYSASSIMCSDKKSKSSSRQLIIVWHILKYSGSSTKPLDKQRLALINYLILFFVSVRSIACNRRYGFSLLVPSSVSLLQKFSRSSFDMSIPMRNFSNFDQKKLILYYGMKLQLLVADLLILLFPCHSLLLCIMNVKLVIEFFLDKTLQIMRVI